MSRGWSFGIALLIVTAIPVRADAFSLPIVAVSVTPNQTRDGVWTTIDVRTVPNARCQVEVYYARTRHDATSRSLHVVKRASAAGRVSWSWVPATKRRGPAQARVRCLLGPDIVTVVASFSVA